ncbi:hypothetical protein KR51_00010280 [Rubidibacter lacunae KORDI 51-2]|uniref:Uncharacterized protein n=1 Tax=Rubidibacter lacunae KORDI 51-2 TaxID=582515 RepID=U5DKT4_9CHRO|nr:hypothetical protein [Rubidibacter lacunae]ERN42301.1 hypothetical protein KR51_00010280 [Rubidibacter lacunae KORDI 51-2]
MNLPVSEPVVPGLLSAIVPLGIWSLLGAFVYALSLAVDDGRKRLQRLHRIPCHRCQYYTGSPYLKCTVHPSMALSEDALDCRDYQLSSARSHQSTDIRTRAEKWLRGHRYRTCVELTRDTGRTINEEE